MRLDFGKEPQLLSFLVINRTKLFESVRHFWLLGNFCPNYSKIENNVGMSVLYRKKFDSVR